MTSVNCFRKWISWMIRSWPKPTAFIPVAGRIRLQTWWSIWFTNLINQHFRINGKQTAGLCGDPGKSYQLDFKQGLSICFLKEFIYPWQDLVGTFHIYQAEMSFRDQNRNMFHGSKLERSRVAINPQECRITRHWINDKYGTFVTCYSVDGSLKSNMMMGIVQQLFPRVF